MNSKRKIVFPVEYKNHKYADIHFKSFLQIAEAAEFDIEEVSSTESIFVHPEYLIFSCLVNNNQIIIDYADHSTREWIDFYPNIPYFKNQASLLSDKRIIPLGPPMAVTHLPGIERSSLKEYLSIKSDFNYSPGKMILNKQLPYGAATNRRKAVQAMLLESFSNVDIDARINQRDFWLLSEKCLVAVCVPGATNNMVDRGHMELLGLGICTISPGLTTLFPYNNILIPNTHYVKCNDDYSDLTEIIKYLENDLLECKRIGDNAKDFYDSVYSPKKYMTWILNNL